MGNAGQVIFFVLLFAASIIVGAAVLAFAARCMLVVVQETAQGQDEILWPKEPYVDWLGHAVLFVELVGIWLAPAALTARLLRHTWLPDEGPLRVLLLAGPGLWLFFPIGLLSSLSAESRWVPFRWAIVQRMLRIAPATLGFYLLTIFVLSAAVVPWYYALFSAGGAILLPVAAGVGAAVLFIYARLLGRLGWLLARVRVKERVQAKPKTEARKPPKAAAKKKRKSRREAEDPWAVPEEERSQAKTKRFPSAEEKPPAKPKTGFTPPRAEELEAYGFASDKPAVPEKPPRPARPSVPLDEEEDDEPIVMQDAVETGPPPERETQTELFAEQVRQRLAERTRTVPPPPPHPFFSGVYTFPFYLQCLPSWLTLSLGLLVVGFLVSQMIAFGKDLFGW
jgi:hypothetical protein